MLQTTGMPLLSLWGVMPDLMLLVVVSWILLRGASEGIIWSLGGGLMLDLLSGGPIGAATIALALASFVASLSELNVPRTSLLLPVTACILATAAYNAGYLVVLQISGRAIPWGPSLLQVVLLCMVVNGLAMYPTYWAMRWLHLRTSSMKLQW